MTLQSVHQQLHGYRNGHELLQSSVQLDRQDQDVIDQLSDVAGPLRAGETFDPYLCAYPLPSHRFYALARTEQDADAPRAGCVKTRTLLVPQSYWERDANPTTLVHLFATEMSEDQLLLRSDPIAHSFIPLRSLMFGELVQALFIEERRPIVVFNVQNPWEVALRILASFWPGMRRSFCICTYALSPRTLLGVPFDLIFAPKTAQARFANWNGRFIEGERSSQGKLHRWTKELENRIFREPSTTLLSEAELQAFNASNDRTNENVLRLSLQWKELEDKSGESPTAALGLIDIATSRDIVESRRQSLELAITHALRCSANQMDEEEAWKYVVTLSRKLEKISLTETLNSSLSLLGEKLAFRDWRLALKYLVEERSSKAPAAKAVAQATARSLAENGPDDFLEALTELPSKNLIKLATLDERLLERIFDATERESGTEILPRLAEGFRSLALDARRANAPRILRHLRGDTDGVLLAELVSDASADVLVQAVRRVWRKNELRTPRLGRLLCDAALANDSKWEIRNAFAGLSDDDDTLWCLAQLIETNTADIEWLLETPHLGHRRGDLLNEVLGRSCDDDLSAAFVDSEMASKALRVLRSNLEKYTAATKILRLPILPIEELITVGLEIHSMRGGAERRAVAQAIAKRIPLESGLKDLRRIVEIIEILVCDVYVEDLIRCCLSDDLSAEKVSRSLVVFDSLSVSTQNVFIANIDLIAHQIAKRDQIDLTQSGAKAVARLLQHALRVKSRKFAVACSMILPKALDARDQPVSPIVVVAFPAVYKSLHNTSDILSIIGIKSFMDEGKRKIARRKLVRAFMNSVWPAADLAITAVRTDEVGRILRSVAKEPGGMKYLSRLEDGARSLKKPIQRSVMATIQKIRQKDQMSWKPVK